VARSQQPGQVTIEDRGVEEVADQSEWGAVFDVIVHPGSRRDLLKRVHVGPVSEWATLHLVGEAVRSVDGDDLGGHAPGNAEMPGPPCHAISQGQRPAVDSSHSNHARTKGQLDVDVEAEIEADIDGSMDRSTLRVALRGVGTAYYLIHSMGGSGSERSFADHDRYAAQNFAGESGALDRIVYLGGL